MRRTLPITKAAEIAEQFDDGEFIAAVESASAAGLQSVEVVTVENDGAGEIYVLRPRTVMIAWKPRDWERHRIAIPDGETAEDIHLTVLFLGDTAAFDLEQQRTIIGVVTQVAQKHRTIEARIDTVGRSFSDDDQDPLWLGGSFPGLREIRDELTDELRAAGIEWEDTFPTYSPHITIGWIPADAPIPAVRVNPYTTEVDNLTIYWGGLEYRVELDARDGYWVGDEWGPSAAGQHEPNLYVPVLKAATEPVANAPLRYTYAPWYVPDTLDLHGEWATRDDLQKALWDYVDSGDRDIRLQHQPDIVAGRWVELATMPFPVTVPVLDEAGAMTKFTYPAGTPFMGVIWEEWSWPMVENGMIKGLSIGGSSKRILVDIGENPDAAATA